MEEELDFEAIGKRLREIRKSKGLKVSAAAKLTGISPGVISSMELGHRNIGLRTLVTFANKYECSIDAIMFGTEENTETLVQGEDEPAVPQIDEVPEEEISEEQDPYLRTLEETLEQMDDAEKEFMIRLILTAHNEFQIVRNKMAADT